MANLEGAKGSETRNGARNWCLCVIIQNDIGNGVSPTTIVAPTRNSLLKQRLLPINVQVIGLDRGDMNHDFDIMCGQIRTLDRSRLSDHCIGAVSESVLERVDEALRVSLQIDQPKMARQTA